MSEKKKLIDLIVGDPDPAGGGKIQTIVFQGADCIVYLDQSNGINWETGEDYSGFPHDFGLISNRVLILEGITKNLFSGKKLTAINYLLAQGLARVIDDKNTKNAKEILDEFETSLSEQGRQLLKIEFIIASFFTTMFVILMLCLTWLFRCYFSLALGTNAFALILAAYCGGIGAFVSSFIRTLNFTGDIRVPKNIYSLDGSLRIFYGLIAGFIIALAIISNVLLGIVNDFEGSSLSLICFLATIAGASESFVPSIIKKVEEKV
jgi:hypothetical protein